MTPWVQHPTSQVWRSANFARLGWPSNLKHRTAARRRPATRLAAVGLGEKALLAISGLVALVSLASLVAVVRAGRTRVALGWYKNIKNEWQAEGEIRGATVDELADEIEEPTYVAGEFTTEERGRLARKRVNILLASPVKCVRRPSILAELAWVRWQENRVDDVASLAPVYLHVAGTPIQ